MHSLWSSQTNLSKLLRVLLNMLNTMSLETIPSMSKPAMKEKVFCRPSQLYRVVGLMPRQEAKEPRCHPRKVCRDAAVLSLSRRQARWPPRRNLLVSSTQGGMWRPSDALPLALGITHKHLETLGSYARLL